jgi:hypothetical protein
MSLLWMLPTVPSRRKVAKLSKRAQLAGHSVEKTHDELFSLEDVDYAIFHSPYGKQAVKGHARMMFNDFINNPKDPRFANIPDAENLVKISRSSSLTDKNVEKVFVTASKSSFSKKSDPPWLARNDWVICTPLLCTAALPPFSLPSNPNPPWQARQLVRLWQRLCSILLHFKSEGRHFHFTGEDGPNQ